MQGYYCVNGFDLLYKPFPGNQRWLVRFLRSFNSCTHFFSLSNRTHSKNRFGSQWLNIIPCKNLKLKLSNPQLRTAGLRLGSKVCERHIFMCGKLLTKMGSTLQKRREIFRLANIIAFIMQISSSTHISNHCSVTKPLQDQSEATRRYDDHSIGSCGF